jgi:hypothetical protein
MPYHHLELSQGSFPLFIFQTDISEKTRPAKKKLANPKSTGTKASATIRAAVDNPIKEKVLNRPPFFRAKTHTP